MRVALFTNNYLPFRGGVTTSVETLRAGLEASGHVAWVFAPQLPGGPVNGARPPRVVRYPSVPALRYPAFALAVPFSPRVAACVARERFEIFHAHHPFLLGPAARRFARRAQRPLVFTYHTRYEKYAHYVPFRRSLVAAAAMRISTGFAARADAVIAPSEALAAELRGRGVGAPIHVVPTGVDLERFRRAHRARARAALGLPPAGPMLLYAGRLDREKSLGTLLEAFARVTAVLPQAHLVFVGDGTEREHLVRRARALPAAAQVHFLGTRPHAELPVCYQAADAFVFASTTETQGLVLTEAAACGLPAVAVDAPGSSEVVVDGETGYLTKDDPRAVADAALALLLDGTRAAAMGDRARTRAVATFGAGRQVSRTLEVYAAAAEAVGRRVQGDRSGPRAPSR